MANTAAPTSSLLDLENRLGDPWDPSNPYGFDAVLAADERAQPSPAEAALDDFGLPAHYVPVELGGRLERMDDLIALLRSLCRRDPVLGYGHSLGSLMAAVNVWAVGDPHSRAELANALIAGERVACGYHELDHGNDLARMDFAAEAADSAAADPAGWVVSGRKEVVTNSARADVIVLYARTDPRPGSRSHSLFLARRSALRPGSHRTLPRYLTSGLRGVQLAGVEFFDAPLPASALVGKVGQGLEAAVRSFQITRIVLPAMAIGAGDLALRIAVRYARGRTLYGAPVDRLELVRSELASTFIDLQLADALVCVAARAVHLRPREAGVLAAASKLFVPQLLQGAAQRLSAILGAQFYLRDGEHALMQKLVRDIPPTGFVHASAVTCQLTLLPQLPVLAARAWSTPTEGEQSLFDLGGPLPPLDVTALSVAPPTTDSVLPGLAAWLRGPAASTLTDPDAASHLASELDRFIADVASLDPRATTGAVTPSAIRLTQRYVVLVAAACALQIGAVPSADAVIARTLGHLEVRSGLLGPDLDDVMMNEVNRRYDNGLGFDLAALRLPSTATPPEVFDTVGGVR